MECSSLNQPFHLHQVSPHCREQQRDWGFALITTEVTLALVLLIGAALMVKGLARLVTGAGAWTRNRC